MLLLTRTIDLVHAPGRVHTLLFPMQRWKSFPRFFLLAVLLIGLLAGISAPAFVSQNVSAAPVAQLSTSVVISEFRTTGPGGGTDEFVEIYNPTNGTIDISDWQIQKSSGCGGTSGTQLIAFPSVTNIAPGQHLLITGAGYTGFRLSDFPTTLDIANDGGIAITNASNVPIDQVGLCATTFYKEGTTLAPLSGTANQSYERPNLGCTDTNNNSADFVWNRTSSDPQNSSDIPIPCLIVTNVSSTAADGIHTATVDPLIPITVTFSSNVNVTGLPILLLETGITDRSATYVGGSGSNTLTFNYTVVAGDVSSDLDYVGTNSLSLNGGSVTGAIGNANLTLPSPGATGSLGNNKAIVIDNGIAPSTISFKRQTPLTTLTNVGILVFRATFSEPVTGVDTGDFAVTGTTGTVASVTPINSSIYDVTVSGGDLDVMNGIVGLNLSSVPTIQDLGVPSLPVPASEPTIEETYTVDNTPPSATVNLATGQQASTDVTPINFTVVFSEPIDVSTFTTNSIFQNGSTTGITWRITDSGNHTTFTLSAISVTATGIGSIQPSIAVGSVKDLAGNVIVSSTSASVTFDNSTPPRVTVNQSVGQLDPTSVLPINFTVVFSKAIISGIFTSADIIQSGTASGITWVITDSGDHTTFTLSATAATTRGTIIPSIPANRVTDLVGNNNTASTSSDNFVSYVVTSTRTATPTATAPPLLTVIINEVAWMGTNASADDEWIELYNPGSVAINLSGWVLRADDESPFITWSASEPVPANTFIQPGQYYLLERLDDTTVSNIDANKLFTGVLNNTPGDILKLFDAQGRLIDMANSNGGDWPAGLDSNKRSMERFSSATTPLIQDGNASWATYTNLNNSPRNGLDASGNAINGTPGIRNWASTVTLTPSPIPSATRRVTNTVTPRPRTATPTPFDVLPVGRPFINEFLPRPGFDWNLDGKVDTFDEFIELKNVGNADMNLSGWRLDDSADFPGALSSAPYTITDLILKPGEYAVFYASQTNILLSDGGDSVRLFDASGDIMDVIDFTIAKVEDESVCRLPDGNGFGSWFNDCTPTPNLTNSRDGQVPTLPEDNSATPFCALPDTLPADFLFAECRGYGANIWDNFYWDEFGWMGDQIVPENKNKWKSFVE